MKASNTFITLVLLTAANLCVHAQDLQISPAELDSLGVEFARPAAADTVVVVQARAHVTIPPTHEYIVSSTLPGLVSRVHARVGERVAEGDVLVEVRSAEFLTLQQEFLEAEHFGALAAAQLERDRQLADEGIIADRRLEETRANAAAAAGRQAEHRQLLKIAGMRELDIRNLQEDLVLQDTLLVRAPVDGAVLELYAKAGESVDAVEALCRMADVSKLWLDIHLPQEYAERIAPGMSVAVRESRVELPGRVISVGQAVDPETQVVSVRADLVRDGHGLRPGQLVAVDLIDSETLSGATDVRSIPVAALAHTGDAAIVFLRSGSGVTVRQVTLLGGTRERLVVRGIGDDELAVAGVSALKALWLAAQESGD